MGFSPSLTLQINKIYWYIYNLWLYVPITLLQRSDWNKNKNKTSLCLFIRRKRDALYYADLWRWILRNGNTRTRVRFPNADDSSPDSTYFPPPSRNTYICIIIERFFFLFFFFRFSFSVHRETEDFGGRINRWLRWRKGRRQDVAVCIFNYTNDSLGSAPRTVTLKHNRKLDELGFVVSSDANTENTTHGRGAVLL